MFEDRKVLGVNDVMIKRLNKKRFKDFLKQRWLNKMDIEYQ